jgi:DNA-binding IclR family transcriptional regulator
VQKTAGYPLDSVDHALRLLLLLRTKGELGVTEAAKSLGVAKSTAHRLLSALRYQDFAVQDAQRMYRPGPELTELRRASRLTTLRRSIEPQLQYLSDASGETSHLMTLAGNCARFVCGVEGRTLGALSLRVGLLLPAHTTSGGKALLAEIPTAALRSLYPRGLPLTRPPAISDVAELRHELLVVRRRGYATNIDESCQGVTAVGRCIHDESGRAVGAIAIAFPSSRGSRQRLTEFAGLLAEAVADVERNNYVSASA